MIEPPFSVLRSAAQPQDAQRRAITEAFRRPEPDCVAALLPAELSPAEAATAKALATRLVSSLRAHPPQGGVAVLMQEFALSSHEGVALMCLAEALLRIPDSATRDALIRDKIADGNWRAHLGHSASIFVNAATWGLMITGHLAAAADERGLGAALTRIIARGGEPVIRKGVDLAMRMMGEQFVTGQTIEEALANSRGIEAKGFRHSYDMLGEAAMTAADAARYRASYEHAIHAIGKASAGRGIRRGPGISIKLSALHPRYARAQRGRVMRELLPRLRDLAVLARHYDIGLNIDAEESERLDLSLDLLEALCEAPELAGWDGIGFVVQAYQKRAPFVLDWIIELGRRSGHRLMIRLVKGAYWDSEIKRAQVDGLADFPVYTRKVHTDIAYIACARRLLAAPDAVFPQFATHNAQTLAAIHTLTGPDASEDRYEFQCLHGMGEPLYEEVVGPAKLNRACRIYAPVGTHETLLAYLVRRLLENGANSSFVNRIHDPAVPPEALTADPFEEARRIVPPGAPHPRIALPRDLFVPERPNSTGLDLASEAVLRELGETLSAGSGETLSVVPLLADRPRDGSPRAVANPADRRDVIGTVTDATTETVESALDHAQRAFPAWATTPPAERAACLERAASIMEVRLEPLLGPIVREAGKTLANAVGEVREAVDFLRYYAARIRDGFDNATHRPLGPVACISPWNFPLAIFTGQVAAALAAGNAVLAKPAEETPIVAALAVGILHEAGVPAGALQLLPGDGAIGAALVADARVQGVMFTGSTEVAQRIARVLAERLGRDGRPVPLIAETGGQNAMVVDSSALPEQVVADVLASAFDSAGQRCSALRVLCLQREIADRVLEMLKGGMAELSVGQPELLSTDVGPVISAEAQRGILDHVEAMRARGRAVHARPLPTGCAHGTFVAPTLIELDRLSELTREVFGPVLHVLRFDRGDLDQLLQDINATGYGLTFGVHSRIDAVISRLVDHSAGGNVYVNRNIIGAVVGVQPFGGHGLSGTGPKAGGPLYLRRLLAEAPAEPPLPTVAASAPPAEAWAAWLEAAGRRDVAVHCRQQIAASRLGLRLDLPGPVGEANAYSLHGRGPVLCVAPDADALAVQIGAVLATGNRAIVPAAAIPVGLPEALAGWIVDAPMETAAAVLHEGSGDDLLRLGAEIAALDGPIRPVFTGGTSYPLELLLSERSVSVNTAAAGGNASLMSLG